MSVFISYEIPEGANVTVIEPCGHLDGTFSLRVHINADRLFCTGTPEQLDDLLGKLRDGLAAVTRDEKGA